MMPYHPQTQVWLCQMHQQEIARAVRACRGVPHTDTSGTAPAFARMSRLRRWLVALRWHTRRQPLILRRIIPATLRRHR